MSPQRESPGTTGTGNRQAMAEDLGTLLQRLEIPARICDGEGRLLFATPDADAAIAAQGMTALRAIRVVLGGETLCVTAVGVQGDCPDLTPRQRAVIQLIAEGLDNEQVAERLQISLHTVRRHLEALMQRLKVRSRGDAQQLLQHYQHAVESRDSGPLRVA